MSNYKIPVLGWFPDKTRNVLEDGTRVTYFRPEDVDLDICVLAEYCFFRKTTDICFDNYTKKYFARVKGMVEQFPIYRKVINSVSRLCLPVLVDDKETVYIPILYDIRNDFKEYGAGV